MRKKRVRGLTKGAMEHGINGITGVVMRAVRKLRRNLVISLVSRFFCQFCHRASRVSFLIGATA